MSAGRENDAWGVVRHIGRWSRWEWCYGSKDEAEAVATYLHAGENTNGVYEVTQIGPPPPADDGPWGGYAFVCSPDLPERLRPR
jgi:hypothetical protein